MPVEAIIIPLFVFVPVTALVIVIITLSLVDANQHLTNNINGHTVEVVLNRGFSRTFRIGNARLVIDGKTVDEIRSYYMYNAKLQGLIDGKPVIVNIGMGFCKYSITTFVDGCKDEILSN